MEKYPEEMTIAIQYQFKSLVVDEDLFKISLSFGGKFEKLVVPYRSITSFADPSMNFALKFSMTYGEVEEFASENHFDENNLANKSKKKVKEVDLSQKVISLDAFRKNNKPNSDINS
jgi:hypothetical protein